MGLINVIIYKSPSGKKPYVEWLQDFDASEKAIFRTRIDRVKLGNFGDCAPIKSVKGLWELSIDRGPGYRIYFGKIKTDSIVILMGGIKKSQNKDIVKAREYWLEYKESENE